MRAQVANPSRNSKTGNADFGLYMPLMPSPTRFYEVAITLSALNGLHCATRLTETLKDSLSRRTIIGGWIGGDHAAKEA